MEKRVINKWGRRWWGVSEIGENEGNNRYRIWWNIIKIKKKKRKYGIENKYSYLNQ